MHQQTISLVLTVHDRPAEVSHDVAESLGLAGNVEHVDEIIVVLDRPTKEARNGALVAYTDLPTGVKFVDVPGPPGWLGPARAWNEGFARASSDLLYCISSEVVQDAGNIEKARTICEDGNTVVFGACHNSTAVDLVVGAEPGLLVSSKMPRPLGFIVCVPADKVRAIGGFDEEFMHGYWYDDDDFFLRLWRTGVDFVFDDSIHGVHLHHERPVLSTEKGLAGIDRNKAYMLKKHGVLNPWSSLLRVEERQEGRLIWRHV